MISLDGEDHKHESRIERHTGQDFVGINNVNKYLNIINKFDYHDPSEHIKEI